MVPDTELWLNDRIPSSGWSWDSTLYGNATDEHYWIPYKVDFVQRRLFDASDPWEQMIE